MVLVDPGTDTGCKVRLEARVREASQRRRWALAPMDVVEPFRTQETAGVLSEALKAHACVVGAMSWSIAAPRTRLAISRSLLVIEPVGLALETRSCCMVGLNKRRKAVGCFKFPTLDAIQIPPQPVPDASTAPR
jgi:hypothetical protein